MTKLVLTDHTSLGNETSFLTALNDNNAAIVVAVENTLSRDGTTPNTMSANLDMNGHSILNVADISTIGVVHLPFTITQEMFTNHKGPIVFSPVAGTITNFVLANCLPADQHFILNLLKNYDDFASILEIEYTGPGSTAYDTYANTPDVTTIAAGASLVIAHLTDPGTAPTVGSFTGYVEITQS